MAGNFNLNENDNENGKNLNLLISHKSESNKSSFLLPSRREMTPKETNISTYQHINNTS